MFTFINVNQNDYYPGHGEYSLDADIEQNKTKQTYPYTSQYNTSNLLIIIIALMIAK